MLINIAIVCAERCEQKDFCFAHKSSERPSVVLNVKVLSSAPCLLLSKERHTFEGVIRLDSTLKSNTRKRDRQTGRNRAIERK